MGIENFIVRRKRPSAMGRVQDIENTTFREESIVREGELSDCHTCLPSRSLYDRDNSIQYGS